MLKTGFLRVALVLPWLLGACGGQGVANTATGAEQRGQGATGSLRSGLYKIVQTGDGGGEEERCITNEIIAAGQYIAVKDLQPGWKIVRNRASGGTVDLEATGPSKGRIVYSGSYTATSFTVDAVMTFEHNGEMMTMKNRETGTFVSADCGKGEG